VNASQSHSPIERVNASDYPEPHFAGYNLSSDLTFLLRKAGTLFLATVVRHKAIIVRLI
jgi:hypothetical protein